MNTPNKNQSQTETFSKEKSFVKNPEDTFKGSDSCANCGHREEAHDVEGNEEFGVCNNFRVRRDEK